MISISDELDSWILKIKKAKYLALDTETTGLEYMDSDLVGISLSVKSGEAAYIPIGHKSDHIEQLSKELVLLSLIHI